MSSGAPFQQPARAHSTAWLAVALASALLAASCSEGPRFMPGGDCELNTDCATSLVCRLGRCRVECRAQRDCDVGLECVRDARGLGACQIRDETMCMRPSDCRAPLVCHFGRCTNECETDRDCPPGASCVVGEGGASGCRDDSMNECELTSECVAMGLEDKVCAVDGRCREACREDWDCRDGMMCLEGPTPVCGWEAPDAGVDGGADAASDAGASATPPPPPRMAASLRNTCVVSGDSMRCWGANPDGQIGDGTWGTTRLAPTAVMLSMSTVRSIGLGEENHACASSGSALECWGNNTVGQLGLDTTSTREPTPVAVTLLPAGAIDDLSLGRQHTCAIVAGALYCWGDNRFGQLGLGDPADRDQPTLVTLPEMAVRVDAHTDHTCVLLASGPIACFGANAEGQIGSGTGNAFTPRVVPTITDAIDVATGGTHACALRQDGTVWCWGSDAFGQIGRDARVFPGPDGLVPTQTAPIPERVLQITAGSRHACALTSGGAVYCWGNNFLGESGQNPALPASEVLFAPTRVVGLTGVEEIVASGEHTCARTSAGDHLCFGSNVSGELGDGTMTESWMPVAVVGL